MQLGYCTNVHAGRDLQQTRENLERHALAVKQRFSPHQPMGVGLWLSAEAARELSDSRQNNEFAAWLNEQGLVPFTLNGFPYGDFHQPSVKHRVYEPTWCETARLQYTSHLIQLLDQWLPPEQEGSISTLPLFWGRPQPGSERLAEAATALRRSAASSRGALHSKHELSEEPLREAAGNLQQLARQLAELEDRTGRLIYLCLEPEPGCVLDRSQDVVDFFQRYLDPVAAGVELRRYVRVCHDVCHAAVMFEPQADVFQRYQQAGIRIGKVQVSSAVDVPFDQIAHDQHFAAVQQLSSFAEDRYLHQTVIQGDDQQVFFDDLPQALAAQAERPELREARWRIHFHVPIYVERFGLLATTRGDIQHCWDAARQVADVKHFEVETYAWGVLPDELRRAELAEGIAAELQWFDELSSGKLP